MAPVRRFRRGRSRWPRVQYIRQAGNLEETIAGDPVRHVHDSYCPYCATDIRAVGPRRLSTLTFSSGFHFVLQDFLLFVNMEYLILFFSPMS